MDSLTESLNDCWWNWSADESADESVVKDVLSIVVAWLVRFVEDIWLVNRLELVGDVWLVGESMGERRLLLDLRTAASHDLCLTLVSTPARSKHGRSRLMLECRTFRLSDFERLQSVLLTDLWGLRFLFSAWPDVVKSMLPAPGKLSVGDNKGPTRAQH